jgi:hypothetical protein
MAIFYHPPAGINDFDRSATQAAQLKQNWHDFLNRQVEGRDAGLFYNPANDPAPGVAAARRPISWNGFPLSIWSWFNANANATGKRRALAAAETLRPFAIQIRDGGASFVTVTNPATRMRKVVGGALGDPLDLFHRQQDEYCEWFVDRDAAGRVTRISFTAEGPEYWEEMAKVDPDLVVRLYQELVNPAVQRTDLFWQFDVAGRNLATGQFNIIFQRGEYNPYNKWNTTHGALHLTHPANTLGAEINLAADATVLRPSVAPQPANTLSGRLICCAQYGGVNRSSDPLIGAGVNGLARAGRAVTLADPIGLYISTLDLTGLRGPNNQVIGAQALRVRRASADGSMILRAEIAPPQGATFTLDQCRFDQDTLTTGGQIARKITMVLFGLAKAIPGRNGLSQPCEAKCCRKPDAPDFRKLVTPDRNCNQLPANFFDDEAPVSPATAAGPVPVVPAVAAPFDEETAELDVTAPPPPRPNKRQPTV